jgi:Phosphotransferase enzyme family
LVPGAPREARWRRPEPSRSLPAEVLESIIRAAFPQRRVLSAEALAGGLRNANFKLALDGEPGIAVLRICEHDPSLCRKEIDIYRLLAGSVPVPQILHAESQGRDGLPPFTLVRWIEGISFHQLKNTADRQTITQAARAAGGTLAAISRIRFPRAGWLGPGPAVAAPLLEGCEPVPHFIDLCLAQPLVETRVARARPRPGVALGGAAGCARPRPAPSTRRFQPPQSTDAARGRPLARGRRIGLGVRRFRLAPGRSRKLPAL